MILRDGTVVEFENKAKEPDEMFLADPAELLPHLPTMAATWHTHPGGQSSNLSSEDWETFLNWPDVLHVIVGSDGPRWYAIKNAAVINA